MFLKMFVSTFHRTEYYRFFGQNKAEEMTQVLTELHLQFCGINADNTTYYFKTGLRNETGCFCCTNPHQKNWCCTITSTAHF